MRWCSSKVLVKVLGCIGSESCNGSSSKVATCYLVPKIKPISTVKNMYISSTVMHEVHIPSDDEGEEEAEEVKVKEELKAEEVKVKEELKTEVKKVEMEKVKKVKKDPAGYTNLKKLFKEQETLCFDNLNSFSRRGSYSNLSIQLFSGLMSMAYYKDKEGLYFKFDASTIIVKLDPSSERIMEVAVPLSQLFSAGCEFDDKVTGPVAALIYDLSGTKRFKEMFDILEKAKGGQKWWTCLSHIFEHPLFWSPEKQIAVLIAAQIYQSKRDDNPDHGLNNPTPRQQKFDFADFRVVQEKNDYYQRDYSITNYTVTYTVVLNVNTLKALVIELDRIFSFSLTIFNALRVKVPQSRPLDVSLLCAS
ncbi:hypothetical protein EJB05_18467, partial [Eragrostis curvula]